MEWNGIDMLRPVIQRNSLEALGVELEQRSEELNGGAKVQI